VSLYYRFFWDQFTVSDIPDADRQFHQDSIIIDFFAQKLFHFVISVPLLDLTIYNELFQEPNTDILEDKVFGRSA
jgi:hypothetical protein